MRIAPPAVNHRSVDASFIKILAEGTRNWATAGMADRGAVTANKVSLSEGGSWPDSVQTIHIRSEISPICLDV